MMEQTASGFVTWVSSHWTEVAIILVMAADKIAKLTPTKADDFVVDILLGGIRRKGAKT